MIAPGTARTAIASLALASIAAAPGGMHAQHFGSRGGDVALRYPTTLTPTAAPLNSQFARFGWRLFWDASPDGPGRLLVRFAKAARPASGAGVVTESIQVGASRDPGVVATCGTAGAKAQDGRRLPDRRLGGHRWTVYASGDAGMSQSLAATALRTVVDGTCYAIDRATYRVGAAEPLPATAIGQRKLADDMDAILASIRVAPNR